MEGNSPHTPTLAETVALLAQTVETLSDRMEKVELILEKFLKIVTTGKGFIAGAFTVIVLSVFGFFGALTQIKEFFK